MSSAKTIGSEPELQYNAQAICIHIHVWWAPLKGTWTLAGLYTLRWMSV